MPGDLRDNLDQESRLVLVQTPDVDDVAALAAYCAEVKQFLAEQEISQTRLARSIELSQTAVGQFLAGKYAGNNRAVADKITFFVNSMWRRQRRSAGVPEFAEIGVVQRIRGLISRVDSFSDAEGRIGVVIGDAGSGKSACLRAFARADKAAVYVCHDSAQKITGLLDAITRASGGDVAINGSLSIARARLAEVLKHKRRLILIDEASSLRAKDLDKLRGLLCVKCGCPLILAGNNDLLRTIKENSDKAGYACLDQFNSRLIGVLNLDELAVGGDGGPLYSAEDICKLYEYGGIRLTPDAVDVLGRICRTPHSGKLRTCRDVIRALHSASQVIEGGQIDAALIWQAIGQLGLPAAEWLPSVCRDSSGILRRVKIS